MDHTTMLECQHCGLKDFSNSEDFQIDSFNHGFWCEICDSFTYLDETTLKHRFTLILEEKKFGKAEAKIQIHNKLSKRLSPYRYPGGKTRIVDYLYTHLQQEKTKKLVSPFTGGASFELALLEAGAIEQLHLNDLDTGVYSLWWLVKNFPFELINRIRTIQPSHTDYFQAQAIIKSDYKGVNLVEAAWASLIVNRLAYSGVVKANPLGGRNGSRDSLLSRWNPNELIKRIEKIHSMGDRIEVTQENALELIEEKYWDNEVALFVDPPYVEKGKDLYHCYYTEKDHRELAFLLDTLHSGCPGADIIVTYDYNKWLDNLYDYPKKEIISRTYSA